MTAIPKKLSRVRPDYDIAALQRAIAEGRVFIAPREDDEQLTRSIVTALAGKIRHKARDAEQADRVWEALLADTNRLRRLRIRQRGRTGEINGYAIAALLTTMLQQGIYESSMKQLCSLAFGDDSERYRRHCNAYITYEDEKEIKKIIITK